MIVHFNKINSVRGKLTLPGDKSITHRAIIFSSLADGISKIFNPLKSDDTNSTVECFRKLGVQIKVESDLISVEGMGFGGLKKPEEFLYAGNSGTTARLLSGILSVQNFESILTGDESLSKRPMKRIIDPLTQMGCVIGATSNNTLPLSFEPSDDLNPIDYQLPVPSAQVKSAIILAGLHLEEETIISEPVQTRDHTENMLGLAVTHSGQSNRIIVSKNNYPVKNEYQVQSDISTAAFFIILTLLSENSEIILKNVLLNESRSGIIKILTAMGADIELGNIQTFNGEKSGDVIARSSKLTNIDIPASVIPNIIDEIPILSIAGLFADGEFKIENAGELRHKESDRIKALCYNFNLLGIQVEESEDGFAIEGEIKNNDILFESFSDHRIAMAFAVLSSLLPNGGKVRNFEAVSVSNPEFINQLKEISIA